MPTGYKLDADSIRMIDNVVRRVMASEPTTRGRQRRPGGGESPTFGDMVISLEDIPAAHVMTWSELDADAQRGFALSGTPPDKAKVWAIQKGPVQPVSISLSGSTKSQFEYEGLLYTEQEIPGPFIIGQVGSDGEPEKITAYNMVPETIHAGKLCQAKRIIIGETRYLFIDVEPCD